MDKTTEDIKRFHIFSIFPPMLSGPMDHSIIRRAMDKELIDITVHDVREHANNKHKSVDDYQYGGGAGMVMKPEPIFSAIESVQKLYNPEVRGEMPVILLSPQGRTFNQNIAKELSKKPGLLLICGRYEGVDERIRTHLATDDISIGDYVLSGGELAAMVVLDSVARLVPGVVGSKESIRTDSFANGMLQHPVYTRPEKFREWAVPRVLLSGDHASVEKWRKEQAELRTRNWRPDLLSGGEYFTEK